jgi:Predicted esterase
MKKSYSGKIIQIEFKSRVLRYNPLKDPYVRKFPVYLPQGYSLDKKYPVIFLLSGFTGTGNSNLNYSFLNEDIEQRLNRLIASGKSKEFIVVMPDCMTKYGGSQYINSSATGQYEDYILEIVSMIDENFSTLPEPENRIVCGKSSGGYGALSLSMRNPDVFGLTYSIAGDMYFEYCYLPDFPRFVSAIEQFGRGHEGVLNFIKSELNYEQPKSPSFHTILNIIGMSACYSPNKAGRIKHGYDFDLPFDINTGDLNHKVFSKWIEKDPVRMVNTLKKNLKALKLVALDAGIHDQFNLNIGARVLSEKLSNLGINHVHSRVQ